MRHKLNHTVVLALVFASVMALSAYSQPYVAAQTFTIPPPNNPPYATSMVRYGGTFVYGMLGDPPHLNPGITTELTTCAVGGAIYETLFNYDYKLNPIPNLAKDIVLSPDQLTYTVHLVQNAVYTDGKPITSADVQFSYDMVYSKYHGKARSLWTLGLLTANKSITTPDPYTVVFKLNKPFLAFPSHAALNTLPILPKHVFEGTDVLTNPANKEPKVTSGPYKLSEWVKGDHITLVPNEKWFRGKPYLDKIVYRIIPDPMMMVAALEKGEVHFIPWYVTPYSEVDRLAKNPNVVVPYEGGDPSIPIVDLGFNVRQGRITSDHKVREAIMRAIDRKYIVDKVTFGVARQGTSVLGSTDPYYDQSLPAYIEQLYGKTGSAEDIAIANRLLDDAGYPKKADGTRFTLTFYLRKDQTVQVKAGEIINEQLKAIGIVCDMRLTDVTAFTEAVNIKWDYDMHIQWWTSVPDPSISTTRLYSSRNIVPIAAANAYGYNSTECDRLMDAAASEMDLTKRKQLWNQVQQLIVKDLPKVVLFDFVQPQPYWAEFKEVTTYTYCHFNIRYLYWSKGTPAVTPTPTTVTTVQPTTVVSPTATQTTTTPTAGITTEMWVGVVVAVIVIVAAAAFYLQRRKKPETKPES